jgi:NADH-quinone oxidoreductase subunit I
MFGKGLIKGLKITWKRMLGKKQTVNYPFTKIKMFPRFHGRFTIDPDKCISCGLCVNACPNNVIQLEKQKVDTKQYLTKYTMKIEYCLFCGLCVEVCPKDAIKFSEIIDMNQYRREWVTLRMVDREPPIEIINDNLFVDSSSPHKEG